MNGRFILSMSAVCGLVLLNGCSTLQSDKNRDEQIRNVAYSVPESVARSGTDVRRKPTKPLWTGDIHKWKESEHAAAAGEFYLVQRGDTIYGIARRLGLPAGKIMELNDMDKSSKLYIGQTIKIPADARQKLAHEASVVKKDESEHAAAAWEFYLVQRGDTIYGIARRLGLPAGKIMELNDMDKSSKLYVGQTIKIPADARQKLAHEASVVKKDEASKRPATVKYTVVQGDSLSRVAKMHAMKVAELRELNNLASDLIRPGQQLDVYKPKNSAAREAAGEKKYALDSDGLYTIQPGDSLDKIARNFGVNSRALGEVNGVDDPLKLQIGKKLIIPSKVSAPADSSAATKGQSRPAVASTGTEPDRGNAAGNGTSRGNGGPDDFFETFDSIKVFEVEN